MSHNKTRLLLIEACLSKLSTRESQLESKLASLQEALESESKSSAGDKFETGRAMIHIDMDKQKSQLSEIINSRSIIDQINPNTTHEKIALGSLVKTDMGNFFMSIGLGKIEHDVLAATWISISPASPIGNKLLDKTLGYKFILNSKTYTILEIG